MVFQQIVLGFLAIVGGVLALKFNFQLVNITGNVGFAEKYLGAGGTYSLYKIGGVVLVIGGLLYMTGLGSPVLTFILSPIAGLFPKAQY
jgi:hypothetical protein